MWRSSARCGFYSPGLGEVDLVAAVEAGGRLVEVISGGLDQPGHMLLKCHWRLVDDLGRSGLGPR